MGYRLPFLLVLPEMVIVVPLPILPFRPLSFWGYFPRVLFLTQALCRYEAFLDPDDLGELFFQISAFSHLAIPLFCHEDDLCPALFRPRFQQPLEEA